MLGTAKWLQQDVLVFWRYDAGRSWIRYPARERKGGPRSAFLFHVIHSEKEKLFHCEPVVEWAVEREVYVSESR